MNFGGIEAGGTKWVCALGGGDGQLGASEVIPTTTPAETMSRAARFFIDHGLPSAIGIGSFGPVDIQPSSVTFGHITTTPKPGWADTDILSPLRAALGVPLVLDTDVNTAAIGEWRWGNGRGLHTFAYMTVGTGIGAGAIVNGRVLHGLLHPEVGHIRIPHDRDRDPFPGSCPFHGDCFEGLASGEAIRQRWGRRGEDLSDEHVWDLEAEYLALGLMSVILTLAPQRVIVGGGVIHRPNLLRAVREHTLELAAGYLRTPALTDAKEVERFIVEPALDDWAGIVGAVELARTAESRSPENVNGPCIPNAVSAQLGDSSEPSPPT